MKKFLAECFELPMIEGWDNGNLVPDEDYTIGKVYTFEVHEFNDAYTEDDAGTKHLMDADYFSKYFKRITYVVDPHAPWVGYLTSKSLDELYDLIDTDKDGYYV